MRCKICFDRAPLDLPIAENQPFASLEGKLRRQFEAAKHRGSGPAAARRGLANPRHYGNVPN